MKRLLTMMVLTSLILFSASEAGATYCRRPADFIVGECSRQACSRAFDVRYKPQGDCSSQLVVAEPNQAELAYLLPLTPGLDDQTKLVIIFLKHYPEGQQSFHATSENVFHAENGHTYEYAIRTLVNGTDVYGEEAGVAGPDTMQKYMHKSYEDLQTEMQNKRLGSWVQALISLYILPGIVFPLLVVGVFKVIYNVAVSQVPLWQRVILSVLVIFVTLLFLGGVLVTPISSGIPFIARVLEATTFIAGIYYFVIRNHLKRRNASATRSE